LASVLQRPSPVTPRKLAIHLTHRPALPLPIFTRLTPAELAKASELIPPVPGMEIVPGICRHYPFPGVCTHVLGLTGRTKPPDRLEQTRSSFPVLELRGRTGLERQYDTELSGNGGMKIVRVNMLGFAHEVLGRPLPPQDGKDLILSLDITCQQAAAQVMHAHRGALVAMNVHTGAILALASSPTYDLATLSAARYAKLGVDNVNRPLMNRALSAGYTPGSVIKPLIALAALQTDAINPRELITCNGAYLIGKKKIHCWHRAGHGPLDLVHAIAFSCNPYFIHAGMEVGIDSLSPLLKAAGIGNSPDIDLPGAGAGLLPSRGFAVEKWRRNWIAIDTAYASIGQGAIAVSPLQVAIYTAAIANGGNVLRPYLVQSVRTSEGAICKNAAPVVQHRLPVDQEHLRLVREGMYQAVNAANGTAKAARTRVISLAGKTGTAEVGSGANRHKHTWFIGFAPAEKPEFAVALLIERGASGGRTAAPVAGRFLTEWLGNDSLATGVTAP
ncbi:MAG: hypothetical protein HON70_45485, partial [Lentisphaerae bacterium]|nr:hypothetical protein [Lentisphaerota bacterium]